VALCDGSHIEVSDLSLPAVHGEGGHAAGSNGNGRFSVGQASGRAESPDALEQVEREAIQKALEACRYNKTKTAAQLGITFRALRYKLKKLEME
jgi:two-component system response regulator PilR (NtrC family)